MSRCYPYDVAVSYAYTEERYVSRVVRLLRQKGLKVFFAPDEQEDLVGENLIDRLNRVYGEDSLFVVLFLTQEYLQRDFTMQEAAITLTRQRGEERICMIPVVFDGAVLPGLDPDTVYLNGSSKKEAEVAHYIGEKVMKTLCKRGEAPGEKAEEGAAQPTVTIGGGVVCHGGIINITNAGQITGSNIQCGTER